MAAFYYKGFDVAEIDSDGFLVPVPSITLDVYNVTAAASLGTVTVDTNAIVAEGSFTGNNGDIVEFSHASYPLTFRQTLTATQDLAYIHPDNHTATYILDNAYASTEEATEGDIYIQDLGDLTQKPVYLGTVKAGETTKLPYQTTLSKNLRLYLVSRDSTGQLSASDMVYAESEDVAVPAPTTGLTGNFLNSGFSINDSAEDHKMTVTVGEDFSANRTLTVTLGNANRQVDIEADLLVAGNATISGINTGDTITVGTTPIGSGTNGRVLFQASSAVSQSADFTFDTSTKRIKAGNAGIYSPTSVGLYVGSIAASISGDNNTCVGINAGISMTSGTQNVFIGDRAGQSCTTSYANIGIGSAALYSITSGVSSNIGIGNAALFNCVSGNGNVAVGSGALAATTNSQNVGIGDRAGTSISSGYYNTCIGGDYAGGLISTGINNTCIGSFAGDNITTGSSNVMIGASVDAVSATASNQTNINDTFVATSSLAWIGGTRDFGVGTTSPSAKFHVISTTEQVRVGYDSSNYYKTTVGSAGAVTFDAVGSGAKFVFSDRVEVAIGTGGETAHLGGKLFQHYTDETTAGTTQEQLYTFTLPAASLLNNGDTIKCEYGGIFTGNGNTKRIYPKFGGNVLATGQTSSASATDWTVDFYVIRVSNTVVRYVVEFTTTGDTPTIESGELTGLNLTTTAYDIDLDGRSVSAAGELTAHSGIGLFYPGA